MSSFKIQHIDHVVLRVSDLERSVAFYRNVLGCELDRRREELGMVHMRAGTSLIDLVDVNGPLGRANIHPDGSTGASTTSTPNKNLDHFCLLIEPFDGKLLTEHLNRAGVAHIEPIKIRYGAEGNGPSLYFYDPDGNRIELKGPSGTTT